MINRLNSIFKGEAWEETLFLKSIEPSTQEISNKDHIEERRERETLSDSSTGLEKLCGSSID